MQKTKRILALLLAIAVGLMCFLGAVGTAWAVELDVSAVVSAMSLDEKLSQMIIPAIRTWDGTNVTDLDQSPGTAEALRRHQYGGVILFASNVKGTEQTAKLLHQLQTNNAAISGASTSIPYFTAVDQEGGIVCRLSTGTRMTGNMALGAAGDKAEENARTTGALIGEELSALGFNMNFAPSVDVNSNPANPIIGVRSFSDDPATVVKLGAAYTKGLQAQKVIGCLKHFPGHGDTDSDTHIGTAAVNKDYKALSECELVPFRSGIQEGWVDMIMTAHITLPDYDEEQTFADGTKGYYPATMSPKVLTDLLRGELGYDGVVVSDALEMGALYDVQLVEGDRKSAQYAANLGEKAVNAGVDILLLPIDINSGSAADFMDAYLSALASKVQSGSIPARRVDESVTRILKLKEKYGILTSGGYSADLSAVTEQAKAVVGSEAHHKTEAKLAQDSVTLLKNENNLLPFDAKGKKIVLLTRNSTEAKMLFHTLKQLREEGVLPKDAYLVNQTQTDDEGRYESVGAEGSACTVTLDHYKDGDNVRECAAIADADLVIALSMTGGMSALGAKNVNYMGLTAAMEAARSAGGKFVLLSAQLPYDAARYQSADAILLCYLSSGLGLTPEVQADGSVQNYNANIAAALGTLFGAGTPTGKLPVNVPVLREDENGNVSPTDEVLYQRGTSLSYQSAAERSISKGTFSKLQSVTWNGKAQKPKFTVTLNGKTLKAGTDYSLSWKDNTNPGTASVTVKGRGEYTGTKTLTFAILPKGTSLSKAKGQKKAVSLQWKAQTKQITGYQVQYSTDSAFKSAKSVRISGAKKTKKTVKKLKSGKKYYFRVRTYKTVKKKDYNSPWSKALSAKTK